MYDAKFNFVYDEVSSLNLIQYNNGAPVLTVGQSHYSSDGNYRITLQTDGNLILFIKNINNTETPLWLSRTQNKTVQSLFFQNDMNLLLFSGITRNSFPV